MRGIIHLFFGFVWLAPVAAQDSLLMRKEVAEVDLLTGRQQLDKQPKSSLALGELMALEFTPQQVYIIHSDQILRQNIATITDVFRLIPGAVVSQSGSAVEGEKFLLHGLSGNSHVKIMINGVPIKPWAAVGMPIGSQLPIRQADRIEVLLGSASSLYGDEACAGVVNIVLEESERPVFTRTNLGFGRLGYNDLDLTFGGKLGRDRNIFKFTLYGRSTVQSDRNIFYNRKTHYNFTDYLLYPDLMPVLERNTNLFPPGAARDSIVPISGAPHESRQFGVMLVWRGVRFRYDLMNRRDYSSIGLNPMAASYRRAGDLIGERIETFSAQLGRTRKRRQSSLLLSLLRYSTAENAQKTHVFGAMGQSFYHYQKRDWPVGSHEQLFDKLFDAYYNGQRSVVSKGIDMRLNYRISFGFKNGLTWASGFVNDLNLALEYSDLLNVSDETPKLISRGSAIDVVYPFYPAYAVDLKGTHFHQFLLQKKNYTIMAGLAGHVVLRDNPFITKRFGALYKLNRHFSLDGNYSEGFTSVSPYYLGNTVVLTHDTNYQVSQSIDDIQRFKVQRSSHFDAGMRVKFGSLAGRIALFGLQLKRPIEGGYFEAGERRWNAGSTYVLYGYMSDAGARTQVHGIRSELMADSLLFQVKVNDKTYAYSWINHANLQLSKGRRKGIADAQGKRVELDYVPNYAPWNFKYATTLVGRKFDVSLVFQMQGQTKTHVALYRDRFPLLANRSNIATARRTIDISARVFLNKHFSAWLDLRNALNRHYDGIDAYATPDDLITNAQPGRTLRFGLQYNLD